MESQANPLQVLKDKKHIKTIEYITADNKVASVDEVFINKSSLKINKCMIQKRLQKADKKESQYLNEIKVNYLISLVSPKLNLEHFQYIFYDEEEKEILVYSKRWDYDLTVIIQNKTRNFFSEELMVYVIYQCCVGLCALHHLGVIHKDIKPGNILFNDCYDVALCDFGISSILTKKRKYGDNNGKTNSYAPPEYLRKKKSSRVNVKYGFEYDVYSLGLVFFELFQKMKNVQNVEPLISGKETADILLEYDQLFKTDYS